MKLLESKYWHGANITQVGQWFQLWGELGKGQFSANSKSVSPENRKRTEKAIKRMLILSPPNKNRCQKRAKQTLKLK